MRKNIVFITVLGCFISGCANLSRLAEVGTGPQLDSIENPKKDPAYKPVQMPMPSNLRHKDYRPNSLWQPGARSFFKDQRANRVGDILTVVIEIDDNADISNATNRVRSTKEAESIQNMWGNETGMFKYLPGVDPKNFVNISSNPSHQGSGNIKRNEKINLKIAVQVLEVLPNGNLVVNGKQQILVNGELRELTVAGVARREDIMSDNTVKSEKLAEARISYGGRGSIADAQEPRYGHKIMDVLMPF